MFMEFITRELYPDELRVLKTLKTQTEKSGSKFKFYHFILATVPGRFLTPLRCVRNDDLPRGGKDRESAALPPIPDPPRLSKRPSFRMEQSEMRNLLKFVLCVSLKYKLILNINIL